MSIPLYTTMDQWRIQRGPSPPPFGRRTDDVTHGNPNMCQRLVLYYGDTAAILSLQTRKTWYSEYSKWLPPIRLLSDSFKVHQIRFDRYPDSLAGLRGPTSNGEMAGRGKGRDGEKKGKEEEGKGGCPPFVCRCPLSWLPLASRLYRAMCAVLNKPVTSVVCRTVNSTRPGCDEWRDISVHCAH